MSDEEKYEKLETLVNENITLLKLRKDFMIEYMRQGNCAETSADLATEAVIHLVNIPDMQDYTFGS